MIPAQLGSDQLGDVRGSLQAPVPGFDGDPGPAGQYVVEMQGTLVGRGVHGLRRKVGAGPAQRRSKCGALLDEGEDLPREAAVTSQQMLDPGHVQPAAVGECLPGVPQRLVAVGTQKRDPLGARGRHVPVHAVDG